jgi:hypothetical protein
VVALGTVVGAIGVRVLREHELARTFVVISLAAMARAGCYSIAA